MKKLCEGFIKDMQVHNYSPTTIAKYAYCARMFIAYLEGKGIEDIRKVGKEELKSFNLSIVRNPKYSMPYVASIVRAIKCFFKYLKKTGAILYDFSIALREPKKEATLPKEPLTPKEVKALLDAPDLRTPMGLRDRAIMEMFYSTGIRVQEASNLTLLDLDLDGGYLTVRLGKGRKDRVVPMGKHACSFIHEYLTNVRSIFLKNNKSEERTNRVWIGRLGNPLTKGDLIRVVRLYKSKVGIKKQVTPHSFRRTLAVELIRNECDFLTVKSILGHSKSETTLQYCALAGEELKDALKRCHPRFNAQEGDIRPSITDIGTENE